MSEQSARLGLPFLAAAQAQKHVTVNESLLRLDALTQLSARSATTSAQPASPSDGDIYLLPAGKTGAAWGAMADGVLAYYRDGVWEELTPQHGWRCYVEDADAFFARGVSSWRKFAAASVQSPVSNSNLVFLRETVTGTALGITALSIAGLWA